MKKGNVRAPVRADLAGGNIALWPLHHSPPVYGGLASIHLNPGTVVRRPIPLPVSDLADHMLLHYTGIAHFSGTNNWELYKRQIEGKKKVQKGLAKIAESAVEMERSLEH